MSSLLEFKGASWRNFEELKVFFQIPPKTLEITLKTGRAQLQARCSDDDDDEDFESRRFGLLGASYKFEKLIFLKIFKFH